VQQDHTAPSQIEQHFLGLVAVGRIGVNPDGTIVRLVDMRSGKRLDPPRPMDCHTGDGYINLNGNMGGRRVSISGHRLVYLALVGPIPPGHEINHKNGIKDDNRPENLEIVTRSGNQKHSYANGLNKPRLGEQAPRSRISDADALEIRRAYAAGEGMQQQLAVRFGVTQQAISRIVTGKVRRWQGGPTHHGSNMKKLTREQHAEIISLAATGLDHREIGRRYGVNRSAVWYILKAAARRRPVAPTGP
jgi:DNA-binding NarL/FixJ family response regulator